MWLKEMDNLSFWMHFQKMPRIINFGEGNQMGKIFDVYFEWNFWIFFIVAYMIHKQFFFILSEAMLINQEKATRKCYIKGKIDDDD